MRPHGDPSTFGKASCAFVRLLPASRRLISGSALVVLLGSLVAGWLRAEPDFREPARSSPAGGSAVARLSVNWQTRRVQLQATLPGSAETEIKLAQAPRRLAKEPPPELQAKGDTIVITGSPNAVRALLHPQTRSLWLRRDDQPRYRIDLPPVNIKGFSARPASGSLGGSLLGLTVEGLLPGFVLYGSAQEGDKGTRSDPVAVRTDRRSVPRLLSVVALENDAVLRVWVPPLPGGSDSRTWFFTLVNADGSQSRSITTVQRAGVDKPTAKTIMPARPAPVALQTAVPSVELLDVDRALELARKANLVPVLVDLATLRELPAKGLEKELVLRQGLAPRSQSLRGELLLLGVQNPSAPHPPALPVPTAWLLPSTARPSDPGGKAALVPADPKKPTDSPQKPAAPKPGEPAKVPPGGLLVPIIPSGASPAAGGPDGGVPTQPVINTNDTLGFVEPSTLQGGLLGIDTIEPTPSGSDTVPPGPSPEGGGLSGLVDGGGGIDPGTKDGTVPVGPDPGILVDPSRPPEQTLLAAILKIVLDSLSANLGSSLPGGLGKAVTEALATVETDLAAALLRGDPIEAVPADRILDIVVRNLNVSLADADRQRALAAWRDYARPRAHPALLDGNHTRSVADDVVVWYVIWLFQNGLYNPAQGMQVVPGPLGELSAILTDGKISPDWLKKPPALVIPGGLVKPPNLDVKPPPVAPPGGGDLLIDDDVIVIPAGPAVVKDSSLPDKVRIPDLKGDTAQEAVDQLNGLGLKAAPSHKGKLFKSDVVIKSGPDAKTWVKPGAAVVLTVERRTPKVLGKSLKDAQDYLVARDLTGLPAHKDTRASDIVKQQLPEPGEPIPPAKGVKLTLVRKVPFGIVKKMDAAAAEKVLVSAGLRPLTSPAKAAKDIVHALKPGEGEEAPVDNPAVAVTLARAVPDLVKTPTNVSDALGILADQKIPIANAKELKELAGTKKRALDTIWVLDQDPDPGRVLLLEPASTASGSVKLKPGSKVPVLKGEPRLDSAIELLQMLDLEPVWKDPYQGKVPLKVVRISDGGRVVPFRTKIYLSVDVAGAPVPLVVKLTPAAASARLKAAGLEGKVVNPTKIVHPLLVIDQKPEANDPKKPSYLAKGSKPVELTVGPTVPDLLKSTVNAALAELKKAGLDGDVVGSYYHPDDRVIKQLPAGHTDKQPSALAFGKKVQLTVTATVPPLVGKTLADAQKSLALHKLSHAKASTDYPRARVVGQKPGRDEPIDRATGKVELTLKVPVPDLTAKLTTLDEAEKSLQQHDLKGKLTVPAARTQVVYAQNPTPSQDFKTFRDFLEPGRQVLLTPGVVMPALKGTQTDVNNALAKVGLKGKPVVSDVDNAQLAGRVEVNAQNPQDPKPGRVVPLDQVVTVNFNRYVDKGVAVPDFRGMTLETAIGTGNKAGVQPQEKTVKMAVTADPKLIGAKLVHDQDPKPTAMTGVKVPRNTVVALYLTRYVGPDPPKPMEGNLVGWWQSNADTLNFKPDGTVDVFVKDRKSSGQWRYANGTLTLLVGQTAGEAKVQWANKDQFDLIGGAMRATYKRVEPVRK